MRLGRYTVTAHSLTAAGRLLADRARRPLLGHRRHDGAPAEIAVAVLRENARTVFWAGRGHFRVMWPTDMGKAFRGALAVLPERYLASLLERILDTSARAGAVPTCFTPRAHYDLPYPRADGAPWLLDMIDAFNSPAFALVNEAAIRRVFDDWARSTLDADSALVRADVTGDWNDTIPRPSSTYNNLCALRALQIAEKWGLETPVAARDVERALLASRWSGDFLADDATRASYLAADANAPALYWGLLPEPHRRRIAKALLRLAGPVGLRTREGDYEAPRGAPVARVYAGYHSANWPHLSLMAARGVLALGLDATPFVAPVEAQVRKQGTFMEVFDDSGRPYRRGPIVAEHGLSMAAGLYLETAAAKVKERERGSSPGVTLWS